MVLKKASLLIARPHHLVLGPQPHALPCQRATPVCMCFGSRSSLTIVCARWKGLVVCQAPKAKVLPTGTGAESNPTNFTPGPSLTPGVPASQSEGKCLHAGLPFCVQEDTIWKELPQVLCVGSVAELLTHKMGILI